MSKHEYTPAPKAGPEFETQRGELMREAVRLTEAGHRLNPHNLAGIPREEAIEYLLAVVERINTTVSRIAARAITPEDHLLPEVVDTNPKTS